MPWLAPSRAAEALAAGAVAEQIRSPLAEPRNSNFRRGALIHRLLQSLPAVPVEMRQARAAAYLKLKGHRLSPEEQQEIASTVMRLLNHHAFGAVFAPDGLAETPIVAQVRLAGGRLVPIVGSIDRMIIRPEDVLILDFKSNRPPPDTLEKVDPSYVTQLALYRRAMLQLFPDKAVRAALLWTEGPTLMELTETLMDSHLP